MSTRQAFNIGFALATAISLLVVAIALDNIIVAVVGGVIATAVLGLLQDDEPPR